MLGFYTDLRVPILSMVSQEQYSLHCVYRAHIYRVDRCKFTFKFTIVPHIPMHAADVVVILLTFTRNVLLPGHNCQSQCLIKLDLFSF